MKKAKQKHKRVRARKIICLDCGNLFIRVKPKGSDLVSGVTVSSTEFNRRKKPPKVKKERDYSYGFNRQYPVSM